MSATSIPAFLGWLHDRVQELELPDVQVFFGQPNTSSYRNDVIIIGWSPADTAVSSEREGAGLDTSRSAERYTVRNLVSSTRGSADMRAVMGRAFELVDAVAGVLAENPTAGGLVHRAMVGGFTVEPWQTTKGADCTIMFEVTVVGHTRRPGG